MEMKMYCNECEEWHVINATDVEVMVDFQNNEVKFTGYCPECGEVMEHESGLGVLL
jgi:predicted RNA-binding Zn-ribbon protein involved in translation (DUF1610 family)